MSTVHVKINGIEVEVPSDYTVLMAAEKAGVHIPTLCYLKDVNAIGACRMCVVEVKGARRAATARVWPSVITGTPSKSLMGMGPKLERSLGVNHRSTADSFCSEI